MTRHRANSTYIHYERRSLHIQCRHVDIPERQRLAAHVLSLQHHIAAPGDSTSFITMQSFALSRVCKREKNVMGNHGALYACFFSLPSRQIDSTSPRVWTLGSCKLVTTPLLIYTTRRHLVIHHAFATLVQPRFPRSTFMFLLHKLLLPTVLSFFSPFFPRFWFGGRPVHPRSLILVY